MSGFTPKYGARPLQGVIRNQIRRPLSRMIISGEIGKGTIIQLDADANGELVWTKN
jgi:ATP-dependent Clp protease ATP-binding subunit ClpA